jgi:type VI secretion system secreted protein Hcp
MKNRFKYALPVAAAAVAVSEPAPAAVDMFLHIENITGESEDKTYKGDIDVLAWSWNVSQTGTQHLGGGGGAGKAEVRDLKVVKYTDLATGDLTTAVFKGSVFPSAKLIVRTPAASGPVETLVLEMTDVLIKNVATGGSGGEDRLTETITINFAKICLKYTEITNDGSAGGMRQSCFDIQANTTY